MWIGPQLHGRRGSYNFGWSSLRSNASTSLSNFNPSVTAQLQAVVSQPLLRNFKIDPLRAEIATARKNLEIADVGLQELATSLSASAQRAYWNLVLARAAVAVQQRSLELSQELERNNRARVDVGQSPPLDLVSARAEVAQRREGLIVAETQVRQVEDQLRVLILDPKRPDFWSARLEPADVVPPIGPAPDVDAAVRNALQQRTDLQRTKKQIENTETALALAKNATLPDLRVQAAYLTNGLGAQNCFAPAVSPAPSSDSSSRHSATCCVSCSRPTTRRGPSGSRSAIRSAGAPTSPRSCVRNSSASRVSRACAARS